MMCAPPTGDPDRADLIIEEAEHLAAAPPTGDRERPDPRIADDAAKLRTLADWFDLKDDRAGVTGAREVQADLRRIADGLDALVADKAASDDVIEALAARIAELEAALDEKADLLNAIYLLLDANEGETGWDAVARLKRERDEAREALRPFAQAAEWADEVQRSDDWDIQGCLQLTAGDLRAARRALAADPEGGPTG